MKTLGFFAVIIALFFFVGCKKNFKSTDEYVVHDGFFISRDMGISKKIDSLVVTGCLSDGTAYMFRPVFRDDYASDSCLIERVTLAEDGRNALVIVGNITRDKAVYLLEQTVTQGIRSVPLFGDHNYYRFNGPTRSGRIDLRLLFSPSVPSELRNADYLFRHDFEVALVATLVNNRLSNMKFEDKLMQSVDSFWVYMPYDVDGVDKESVCIYVKGKNGNDIKAIEEMKQALEQTARPPVLEAEVNIARASVLFMLRNFYYNCDSTQRFDIGFHMMAKHVADALVRGVQPLEFFGDTSDDYQLQMMAATYNSDIIGAMFERTLLDIRN